MRRRVLAAGGTVALIASAAVVLLTQPFSNASEGGTGDNATPTALATVTRQTLSAQTQVSATLGYAGSTSVVQPAGTSPAALLQAQQGVTTAQGTLDMARMTSAADARALQQARARLSADRQKRALDCRGGNAAETPAAGSGGEGATGACAADHQTVATDEQAVTAAQQKAADDGQAVASAERALAAAQTGLATARASATAFGESASYTELPDAGQVVKRGQTLYRIADQPVVLLYGATAAWRAFGAGMSPGRDVAQLNANLRALGFGRGLSGSAFSSATAAAVRAFQSARGLEPTGRLLLGAVVFKQGALRVTSVTAKTGAVAQAGPVLEASATVRQVTIELDAGQQAGVKVGDPVTITLPDNSTTSGVVSSVGTVATAAEEGAGGGGGGSPTIQVHVTPSDPDATGRLDQAPVAVSITTASVEDALVVPVVSLLALAGGGYAVEEVTAAGVHRLIGVTLGLFDDAHGLVQVTGTGLAPGRRIVVPAG